jgi:hypothetical protein
MSGTKDKDASGKPPATVEDIMSTADMKPILLEAKRGGEVSCVVGLSREKDGVILLDKRTPPKQLRDQLKKQAQEIGLELEASSLRYGTARVDAKEDPKVLSIAINKQGAGVLEQKLRERLKSAGFKEVEITIGAVEFKG